MTQAPPTLEYQRLERARKTAIGGLRLLGLLMSILAAAGAAFTLAGLLTSMRLAFPRRIYLVELFVMFVVFGFGLTKFLCAMFVARRSRAAAIVGLCIVLVECAGLGLFWLTAIRYMIVGRGYPEPILYRGLPALLMFLVLLGWLAVAYELLHVLRHEQPDVL